MGCGGGRGRRCGDCAADGGQRPCGQPARERRGAAAGGGSRPRAACQPVRWPGQDLTPLFLLLLTRALFQGLEKLA